MSKTPGTPCPGIASVTIRVRTIGAPGPPLSTKWTSHTVSRPDTASVPSVSGLKALNAATATGNTEIRRSARSVAGRPAAAAAQVAGPRGTLAGPGWTGVAG